MHAINPEIIEDIPNIFGVFGKLQSELNIVNTVNTELS